MYSNDITQDKDVDKEKDKDKEKDNNNTVVFDNLALPELILYSDDNGYDVETYIQIYNCMGFLMQVEVEAVNAIIRNAKKAVMTIKSMAAGRTTPFVGLNFSWATIRDCDMVTVGCFNEHEAEEDIEISLAALERRTANIAGRNSPAKEQSVLNG